MFDCTDENKQKEAVPIFEKAAVQKCIFSGNSVEVFPVLNQKNRKTQILFLKAKNTVRGIVLSTRQLLCEGIVAILNWLLVSFQASGSSADWAYDKAKVKYSFALELRDQGQTGFMLPVSQVPSTSVTRWLDYFSFFVHSLQPKFAKMNKNCQNWFKILPNTEQVLKSLSKI